MGDRGDKIAARQAELSRRKRRDKQPSIPAGSVPPPQTATGGSSNPASPAAAQPAQAAPMVRPAARPFVVRRSKGMGAPDVAPAYPYLKSELRNIAIVMAGLVAILIALTFVLR